MVPRKPGFTNEGGQPLFHEPIPYPCTFGPNQRRLYPAGVDILTLGQYLQPTPLHLSVKSYVTPDKFEHWRRYGEEVVGFR